MGADGRLLRIGCVGESSSADGFVGVDGMGGVADAEDDFGIRLCWVCWFCCWYSLPGLSGMHARWVLSFRCGARLDSNCGWEIVREQRAFWMSRCFRSSTDGNTTSMWRKARLLTCAISRRLPETYMCARIRVNSCDSAAYDCCASGLGQGARDGSVLFAVHAVLTSCLGAVGIWRLWQRRRLAWQLCSCYRCCFFLCPITLRTRSFVIGWCRSFAHDSGRVCGWHGEACEGSILAVALGLRLGVVGSCSCPVPARLAVQQSAGSGISGPLPEFRARTLLAFWWDRPARRLFWRRDIPRVLGSRLSSLWQLQFCFRSFVMMALQTMFAVLTVAAIMHVAGQIFGAATAKLAGAFWAVSPPLLWLPAVLWETSLSTLLLIGMVALALRAWIRPGKALASHGRRIAAWRCW